MLHGLNLHPYWCNRYRLGYAGLNISSLIAVLKFGTQQKHLVIFLVFYLVTTLSFFIVQGSDPGYVGQEGESQDNCNNFSESLEEVDPLVSSSNPHCSKCLYAAPERSHHCRTCNRCVHKFDHHCHVIGTCVGERNHCRFWWTVFLHTAILLSALRAIWMSHKTGALAFKLLLGFLSFPMCTLLVSHTFLAIMNRTSYESIKSNTDIKYNPQVSTRKNALWFIGQYVTNVTIFCCDQDSVPLDYQPFLPICLGNHMKLAWTPITWVPSSHPNSLEVDVRDDICDNRYYSCC